METGENAREFPPGGMTAAPGAKRTACAWRGGYRLPSLRSIALPLGNRLHVFQSGLEVLADHGVHADKHLDHLGNERRRPMHRPGDPGAVALLFQREFGDVVAFERL